MWHNPEGGEYVGIVVVVTAVDVVVVEYPVLDDRRSCKKNSSVLFCIGKRTKLRRF